MYRLKLRWSMVLAMLIMGISSLAASYAMSPIPEESAAPVRTDSAPAVRYWKSDALAGSPWTIDPRSLLESSVPERSDPKIVPVMYHNIVFGRTGNVYNRDIYNFEHDLAFLRRNYAILDFQDLVDIKAGKRELRTDGTIITFDDGDLSVYAIAYPLLKELDMKATFFIVPGFIGEVGYMSWDQVREMDRYRNASGDKLFAFGSHSLSHRPLGELPGNEVLSEMRDSKRIIEEQTGTVVIAIALPFGSGANMPEIRKAAQDSGYLAIRTSNPGAIPIDSINLWNVRAFNVENYSSDTFVQHMLRMAGR